MALHKQKVQPYIPQPQTTERTVQKQAQRPSRKIFTKGEKMLFVVFLTIVVGMALMSLQTQSSIHSTSIEIQQIEKEIEETNKQNTDLSNQVSELSRYDRIWTKAKELGLTLKEHNVKVVPGQ